MNGSFGRHFFLLSLLIYIGSENTAANGSPRREDPRIFILVFGWGNILIYVFTV